MNNYDDLKVEVTIKTAEEISEQKVEKNNDLVVSVIEPKAIDSKKKKNKNKIFNILMSSLKAENFKPTERESSNEKATVPILKYTVISFFIIGILGVFLFCFKSFVSLRLLIPITLIYTSIAVPIIILVFFIEFNTRKTIRTLNVTLMFILGTFSCILVQTFCYDVLIRFIQRTYLDAFVIPLIWAILLYILVSIFCNVLKVSKMSECFLIAISFSVGYSVARSLIIGYENLFIVTELNILNGQGSYFLPVIINETEDLMQSFNKMLETWYLNYLFMPLLFACMSIMVGSVVSGREQSKKNKLPLQISIFLLIPMSVLFYAFSVIQTNFISFNLIIKLLSLATSLFISLKLINKCIETEYIDVS